MKPIQKLFLFLMGAVLLTADANATRWLTRDPMDIPQHMERDPLPSLDLNQYTFVRNNPVNVIDPFGLEGNPISGAGQSYSSDIYGGAGTFYSAGYLWNDRLVNMGKLEDLLDPPLYPNPTLPAPVNAVFWDPHAGQWILQREGLQSDPVMDSLMFGIGGALRGSAFRVCPASQRTTYLYQKLGANGEHLKFGITASPATRYTAAELNGGQLNILAQGAREDMLELERSLHETLPIGSDEGQQFYIQKQINNGLSPPPY